MVCNVSELNTYLEVFPGCDCEQGLGIGELPSSQRRGDHVNYYPEEGEKV